MKPAVTVDKKKELQAAMRWARRVRPTMSEPEKRRHWRHMVAHCLAALTGRPVDREPESGSLL